MDDLISRKQVIDVLDKIFPADPMRNDFTQGIACGAALAKTYVEDLPSAEPKMGRWISADAIFGGVPFYCSECGENTLDTVMGKPRWNYCPNCGSDMRGEQYG